MASDSGGGDSGGGDGRRGCRGRSRASRRGGLSGSRSGDSGGGGGMCRVTCAARVAPAAQVTSTRVTTRLHVPVRPQVSGPPPPLFPASSPLPHAPFGCVTAWRDGAVTVPDRAPVTGDPAGRRAVGGGVVGGGGHSLAAPDDGGLSAVGWDDWVHLGVTATSLTVTTAVAWRRHGRRHRWWRRHWLRRCQVAAVVLQWLRH